MLRGNINQCVEWLLNQPKKGAKKCAILTLTHPELLKKHRVTKAPCQYVKGVARLTLRGVTLGASYENAVNAQREEEEKAMDFVAKGLWVDKSGKAHGVYHSAYTVQHDEKGTIYFPYKPAQFDTDDAIGSMVKNWRDKWMDAATGREITGAELDDLKANLLKDQPHKAENQELDHDVQWRTIKLENVVEVRYAGVFTLEPAPVV